MITHNSQTIYGTTIVSIRRENHVVMAGDGQVTLGSQIMKGKARKIRRIGGGKVLAGFAGATADAFALLERLETKLEQYPTQLARACVEMAKDWRTDRYLRKLEAMMIVADNQKTFLMSGTGDVIEPDDDVISIGSGGGFALAAAKGMLSVPDVALDIEVIAKRSLEIAAQMCIYTNDQIIIETLS
ncbi:MAG: ATP-dependent protease subunit HslV [Proteobacteria bacterium]|jgi:ATP-dependent HslUV protease subunit HslV|nr:ATP-dependent protease subunit HslV [Pseudomonadota bacterium]